MWTYEDGASYQDSVTVVMKGSTIELERILTAFTTIDLSGNLFGGDILELIGDLKALKGLNLSHNNLTGNIPPSIGNLTNLEWLDLSSNKLDGRIPRGLADLTMLAWLNLSDNQLVGPAPRSTQFDTFSHSFDGNPGLCGHPLPKACGTDDQPWPPTSPGEREEETGSGHWIEWRAVPMGYGCGLALGISAWFIMWETLRPRWLVRMIERLIYRMTKRKMRNVAPGNRSRRNTRGQ
ncbi:receptor-like protein 9DC3 isoform X2 [Punica granatum]|uniref:Receptor-like protein 9DC3 isoform X2 n=1 Tax=Punica granatum TaxID=22663 RepID=A0A6P8E9M5_PUNGR|nr:receptor-like protein 9DC3 isoform X2 [Punica granatum]